MRFISIIAVFILVGIGLGLVMRFTGTTSMPDDPPKKPRRTVATETDWNDYLWPTDASRIRTSDFAEFRATHFHAGIDISTNMKQGFKVFASREGWLHSVMFEPYGYGWFLVLRHDDGYHTCYAHLKGFPAGIMEAYRTRLAGSGRSFGKVEWRKDEMRFKKGDVIAFTGATGAGPPHLHFEVRDQDFHPVNPGISVGLRPRDTIPPVLRQLCLLPLDASSTVNGRFEPLILPVVTTTGGVSVVREQPTITGRVGLMLRATDQAQEAQDAPTPYDIEMAIGGKRFFRSRFDWMQKNLGWHIRIDRDNTLMLKRKGEFRKLFVEEGNTLAVYEPDSMWSGVLSAESVGEGKKILTLIARDISGNASHCSVNVLISRLRDAISDSAGSAGRRTNPLSGHGRMTVTDRILFDEIVLDIKATSGFHTAPAVTAQCNGVSFGATLVPVSATEYRAVIRGQKELNGDIHIAVAGRVGDTEVHWNKQLRAAFISPSTGGTMNSTDGNFRIDFPPYAVYRSLFCGIESNDPGRMEYHVWPGDIPLAGSVNVSFRSNGLANFIFSEHTPGMRFADRAAETEWLTAASTRYLGCYRAVMDKDPPTISVSRSTRSEYPVRIAVRDTLSGVFLESLRVAAGDVIVPVEYSEQHHCFVIPAGVWHSLRSKELDITVSDKAGNIARQVFR